MAARPDDEIEVGGPTGMLHCTTFEYIMPNSALRVWEYAVLDIPLANICTVLWDAERDLYSLSEKFFGCRWWV
jgi:hypothetical protein